MPELKIKNCKRCGCVFRSNIGGDSCQSCANVEFDLFQQVYSALQDAGEQGIPIDALSEQVNTTTAEIMVLFETGKLGIAANALRTYCQGCNILMGPLQRVGKYCQQCAVSTANAAGVRIKSRQQLERATFEEQKREELLKIIEAKPAASSSSKSPQGDSGRQFGFRRS